MVLSLTSRARVACGLAAVFLLVAAAQARAAPASLAPSQFNDEGQVDTDAVGNRIPVVLVHGLGGSTDGWDAFLKVYAQDPAWRAAFKPYSFRYNTTTADVLADPSGPRTIKGIGGALRDAMQAYYGQPTPAPHFGFGNKRVVVLAHSMGGLVARSMMQEHVFADGERGGQKVLHLITLGSPHHGSQLADAAIATGLAVSEYNDVYPVFLAQMTWTNHDSLNQSSGLCNPWLALLNNYAPSNGASYGSCGNIPANPLPGFYDRIIAYGTSNLQSPDLQIGNGVFKPGSAPALTVTYSYLHGSLARSYPNDGIVPLASAQFEGPSLWQRGQAFQCDHRYIKRGYPEVVRTSGADYSDWAFCAATSGAKYPSGTAGGYAVSGSIFGVAGGVVDTIKTASQAERVMNWAEQAYAPFLQPSGAMSGIAGKYYYRYYPASNASVGVMDGNVYYRGPESKHQIMFVATLPAFLAKAQLAGY